VEFPTEIALRLALVSSLGGRGAEQAVLSTLIGCCQTLISQLLLLSSSHGLLGLVGLDVSDCVALRCVLDVIRSD
jgi:hypothetical protein